MVSDVPVGTFMSGGIDSTTISAIAAQRQPGIKAFTTEFGSAPPDMYETEEARATAAMHPMDHIVQTVPLDAVHSVVEETALCFEELYPALSTLYFISEAVHQHGLKVVLNGLGGDELFAGYSHYQWSRLWPLMRVLRPGLTLLKPFLGRRHDRLMAAANSQSAGLFYTAMTSVFSELEKRALFAPQFQPPGETAAYLTAIYGVDKQQFSDDLETISYLDIMSYIGNHHVYRVDQFTMHFSIEGRLPFLDHELVELAFRMPSRHKLKCGPGKAVLRSVSADLIAPACLQMKKKGFRIPLAAWMKGPLREMVDDRLADLSRRAFINASTVESMRTAFFDDRLPAGALWSLVSMEIWHELFIDNWSSEESVSAPTVRVRAC